MTVAQTGLLSCGARYCGVKKLMNERQITFAKGKRQREVFVVELPEDLTRMSMRGSVRCLTVWAGRRGTLVNLNFTQQDPGRRGYAVPRLAFARGPVRAHKQRSRAARG